MAYIDSQVSVELTALAANPKILDTLSFKTRLWIKKAINTVGPAPGSQAGFGNSPSWEQTNIINEATVLATS
jgi:hypothetical protein